MSLSILAVTAATAGAPLETATRFRPPASTSSARTRLTGRDLLAGVPLCVMRIPLTVHYHYIPTWYLSVTGLIILAIVNMTL